MKNKDKTDVRTVTFARRDIKTDNIVLYKPANGSTEQWRCTSKRWSQDSPEVNGDDTMTMTEEQVYCSSKRALRELKQAEWELNRAKNRMESLRHVSALLASQGSNQGLTIAV
jgi:hypothetical protein